MPTSSTWVWNAGTGPSSSPARPARSSRSRLPRAIDLAIGERTSGPLFRAADGKRLDRHGAARIVCRVTRRAGISKQVSPHTLRHAFITAALDAGVPLRDVQEAASHPDPHTTCATTWRAPASTATRPTSSRPTSPEPPGSPWRRPPWPDRPISGQAMAPGQTAVRAECHTGTVISLAVMGSMRELSGFELEPEVRDWLDGLSDSDYKRR